MYNIKRWLSKDKVVTTERKLTLGLLCCYLIGYFHNVVINLI